MNKITTNCSLKKSATFRHPILYINLYNKVLCCFKLSSDLQMNTVVFWQHSSGAQRASTCSDDTRSDKRKETQTEPTDLYQNFRSKTTICERITDRAYEIANTDQSATEQRPCESLDNGRRRRAVRLLEFYCPLCSSDGIKAHQQHLLVWAHVLIQRCWRVLSAPTHWMHTRNRQFDIKCNCGCDLRFIWNADESKKLYSRVRNKPSKLSHYCKHTNRKQQQSCVKLDFNWWLSLF